MKRWVWRHIELFLPDDWEMLRYSRDMAAGNCLFADRYRIRLECSWRAVPGPPDFERMMDDYAARLREAGGDAAAPRRVARLDGWQGLELAGSVAHSRYGAYLAGESLLIELVVFWPEGCDEHLLRTLLSRVRVAKPTAGGLRPWVASGVCCAVEPALNLHACAFEPARAELVFMSSERERLIRRFQRLGMVERWLQGGIDEWLSGRVPRETRITGQFAREQAGHTIHRIVGRRRRLRMTLFGDRWMTVEAAAWRCPRDGRLYYSAIEYPSRERSDRAHPERELDCCGGGTKGLSRIEKSAEKGDG